MVPWCHTGMKSTLLLGTFLQIFSKKNLKKLKFVFLDLFCLAAVFVYLAGDGEGAVGPFWHHFGPILESFWHHFGIIFIIFLMETMKTI